MKRVKEVFVLVCRHDLQDDSCDVRTIDSDRLARCACIQVVSIQRHGRCQVRWFGLKCHRLGAIFKRKVIDLRFKGHKMV
eukprot:SAG11_NODE_747_length_7366_cov_7.215632_8_plen_80_part_00